MNRRLLLKSVLPTVALAALGIAGGTMGASAGKAAAAIPPAAARLRKTPEEWRALLPQDRYEILFDEGTEAPGSHPLNLEKGRGTYICAACFLPLFDSAKKFDSGTGWPSFWAPLRGALATKVDRKLFLARTEYHCIRCTGHQGHVFDDGPPPTGQRYCNNGLALQFVPRGRALPALRA